MQHKFAVASRDGKCPTILYPKKVFFKPVLFSTSISLSKPVEDTRNS